MRLPTGKLKLDLLSRLLEKYSIVGERVVVGPGVGQDAAVIDFRDRYLIVKTDPITFVTGEIGFYAVNINANDIACMGGLPRWFLATLLLPEGSTTKSLVEGIFSQISSTCRDMRIEFIGGHTEITYDLNRPIVVGQMLGEVEKDKLVSVSGARVGDHILITKGIPIEAASIIAREKEEELSEKYSPEFIARVKDFLHRPGISVLRDAQIALRSGEVHALHDPTEGGLATGLHELALAAGVGMIIQREKIPILPEGEILCREYGLDPLGSIASGTLIIVAKAKDSEGIIKNLGKEGISAAIVGEILPKREGLKLREGDSIKDLPLFERDEITKIY